MSSDDEQPPWMTNAEWKKAQRDKQRKAGAARAKAAVFVPKLTAAKRCHHNEAVPACSFATFHNFSNTITTYFFGESAAGL